MTIPPSDDLASHALALRSFARALCQGAGDVEADDLSQAALVVALERNEAPEGSTAPWLRGVTRYLALRHLRAGARRRRHEQEGAKPERVPSAMERAARLELEQRLIGYLRELPEAQGEAVYLRYWESLEPRKIAQLKGVPVGTVKTRIKRGLQALRDRLTETTEGGREVWLSALSGTIEGVGWKSAGAATGGLVMKKIAGAMIALLAGSALWMAKSSGPEIQDVGAARAPSSPSVHALEPPPEAGGGRLAVSRESGTLSSRDRPQAGASQEVVRTIEGVVLDVAGPFASAKGAPAEGVEVRLSWGMGIGWDFPSATTDRRGRFRFELADEALGQDLIHVTGLGDDRFRGGRVDVQFDPEASGERDCEVRRHLHGSLLGTVEALSGEPLEGVAVRAAVSSRENPLPEIEVTTDEQGRFRFDGLPSGYQVAVAEDSWVPVHSAGGKALSDGSWSDLRIVLAERSTLEVRVVDANGTPVPGARVTVEPSAAERFGGGRALSNRGAARPPTGETNDEGAAMIDGVWCHQKLCVVVRFRGQSWRVDRQSALDAHPGRAIVAGTERRASCTAVIGVPRVVTGRVLTIEGLPAEGASVCLRSAEGDQRAPGYLLVYGAADENGEFTVRFYGDQAMGEGRVLATDGNFAYLLSGVVRDSLIASQSVGLESDTHGVSLQLAPPLEIAGAVTNGEGEGVRALVEVIADAPTQRSDWLPNGLPGWGKASSTSGRFRIQGLSPGSYSVRVVPVGTHGAEVVEGVAAGTSDLRVEVAEEGSCSVTIEVVAPPGAELDSVGIQHARLMRPSGHSAPLMALPPEFELRTPEGYPFETANRSTFFAAVPEGTLRLVPYGMEASRRTLKLPTGPGGIGVSASTVDGWRLVPMGTGLVELCAGHHHVRFHFSPVGSVEGHVPRALISEEEETFVAIARPGGDPVTLSVRERRPQPRQELGIRGDFFFPSVPTGNYELWVGTERQLTSRSPTLRRPFAVLPWRANAVDLE